MAKGAKSKFLAETGKPITPQLAEEALREVFSEHKPRSLSAQDVITAVCQYYAVTPEDVTGPRRNRSYTVPRQMVMYLCRKLTDLSLPKIGEALGGRDHTTVLHGCSKVEEMLSQSGPLRAAVDDITKQLRREG